MLMLFNGIMYGIIFRILGGGIIQLPRWIPLVAIFAITALQVPSIPLLLAYVYLFCVIRLLATRPLLDACNGDKTALLPCLYRSLAIVPALPFTSWWYAVFLLQGALYYAAGEIAMRYPKILPVTASEIISGFCFGLLIGTV